MSGRVTSFIGLFDLAREPAIRAVRIPIIQRDYAQGRVEESTVRDAFLDSLKSALTGDAPLTLDFVFGDVTGGTLSPLDGQQRLTTLFLLHWYLSARAATLPGDHPWTRFTYETRESARRFCERLAEHAPPAGAWTTPAWTVSRWVGDQPWFRSTWRHDPTIEAMRVMLDAMHARLGDLDPARAWARLTDPARPAVSFHLLSIKEMGLPDELYIKMNSRGKPLTPFENFKATFESVVESVDPQRAHTFAERVDGAWSDLLWPMRGDDNLIDDEFLRYFDFVTDVCAWRDGLSREGPRLPRAERVFGASNPNARENLDFLSAALDTWCDAKIPAFFEEFFSTSVHRPGAVAIFTDRVNLLEACCREYERFGLPRTLLLLAAVVHRVETTTDFARRVRVLRNLIEASENELRAEAMPALVRGVTEYLRRGDLADLKRFNARQLDEERRKEKLLASRPDLEAALFALEDHPLLRGSVGVFALDEPDQLAARAATFHKIFDGTQHLNELTGALLACGAYGRRDPSGRFVQLGSPTSLAVWRALFANPTDALRAALMTVLDRVERGTGTTPERLAAVRAAGVIALENHGALDWRYYVSKYASMREGESGIYAGGGYAWCMLRKVRMSSHYRDPFLLAMLRAGSVRPGAVEDPWFTGYETEPRWMRLTASGAALRCVDRGVALKPPTDLAKRAAFDAVCAQHGVGSDGVLAVPQQGGVDTKDRVAIGAKLLSDLVAAGC